MLTLPIKRRGSDWWITGLPEPDVPECGPYETRTEAVDDQRGLKRWYKHGHKRSYVTSLPPREESSPRRTRRTRRK